MMDISELGDRICIIGPNATGKSTLSQALSDRLGIPVYFLDQLAHVPYTNWEMRPFAEFQSQHQDIIQQHENWIIEGNYSKLMPERFARATVVIWLDFSVWGNIKRYLQRAQKKDNSRPGNLVGADHQWRFSMLYKQIFTVPKLRKKYQLIIEDSKVPMLKISTMRLLKAYYRHWNLNASQT